MRINTRKFWLVTAIVGMIYAAAAKIFAQTSDASYPVGVVNAVDAVVTILLGDEGAGGEARQVGSGLVVRSDGYVLTAHHLVRGARQIQVRLRNGEIFDGAEIVAADERRGVALLRVRAAGLRVIPNGTVEEGQVGSRVFLLANPPAAGAAAGQTLIEKDGLLDAVRMADGVEGAGKGYRVLQLIPGASAGAAGESFAGGLVLDERGRSLGIVTTSPAIGRNQNIAVPLSSVLGLIRSVAPAAAAVVSPNEALVSPRQSPVPIPQSSVQVPERGVLPLAPKGPGSVVVRPHTPKEVLASSKTIYVTSRTVFFKPEQMVNALSKRREISDWGLSFVEEREVADLILEIDHVVLTYKYTFKLYSQRLGATVATGNVIIWDGNLGADWMANRVVEKLTKVRASPDAPKTGK